MVLEKADQHQPLIGNAASIKEALEANLDNHSKHIGIFPSDQILLFDQHSVLQHHLKTKAQASILTQWRNADEVSNFGVLKALGTSIVEFIEKPTSVPEAYIENNKCRINMGIYWFDRTTLYEALLKDANNTNSSNDFGHNVLPLLIKETTMNIIDVDPNYPWEDVGTLEQYWNAHWKYRGDFQQWNIKVTGPNTPQSSSYTTSPVPKSTTVEKCIIFDSVTIGEHCNLSHLIIDSNCILEDHISISLETPITGTVYKTNECIIIPKGSLIRYSEAQQLVIVAPL